MGQDTSFLGDETWKSELVVLTSKQSFRLLPAILLCGLVTAYFIYQTSSTLVFTLWVSYFFSVIIARACLLYILPRLFSSVDQQLKCAVLLNALYGAGLALSVLFINVFSEIQASILSMLIVGLVTGSIASTYGYRPLFFSLAIPSLWSLGIAWFLRLLDDHDLSFTRFLFPSLIFIFFAIVSLLANYAFSVFKSSFDLRNQQIVVNRQLQIALEDAKQANASKTRFLAVASHDLRQPIHALKLFIAALEIGKIEQPKQRSILANIKQSIALLSQQLDALLDISKLDAGIIKPKYGSIYISPLLKSLCDEFAVQAASKGVDIKLDIQVEKNLYVNLDIILLERVLRNIIDNAIKYTPRGTVIIRASVELDSLTVAVHDTGLGISEEECGKVFDEFYQTDNLNRELEKGLGLGLSIVKRLCRILDIDIHLQSALGRGTQFSLVFPHYYIGQTSYRLEAVKPHAKLKHKMQILVIDDDHQIRESMQFFLHSLGHSVELAAGRDEAESLLRLHRFDAVLCDFGLKVNDEGLHLIQYIAEQYEDIPLIVITGDTQPDKLQLIQRIAPIILHKPVNLEVLLDTLSQVATA